MSAPHPPAPHQTSVTPDRLDGVVRAAIALADTLPSPPHVVTRLLALTDADDTRDLLDTIDHDPALTARILRTANSPFFAQTRSVTSVGRAVLVLGMTMVRNLTLGLTVWDATASSVAPQHGHTLWAHSVAVAHAAQHLALRTRSCAGPDAFTAGLLHDVGKLVLAKQFPDAYRPILVRTAATPVPPDLERAAVGLDHAEVGALLFDRWRLPKVLVDAVVHHHDAHLVPGLPGVVAAADTLLSCGPADHDDALTRAAEAGVDAALWEELREAVSRSGTRPLAPSSVA
jgi:putative nucleotidyltransferase with HDIG domain